MQKLVANSNRKLTYVVNPATVTCKAVETDGVATRTQAGGAPALLNKIHLECTMGGTAPGGAFSTAAPVPGDIVASTPRVQDEAQSLLVLGDTVTIQCVGTVTSGTSVSSFTATVTVTITDAGQLNIFANRP
jgi:hypothetical protein